MHVLISLPETFKFNMNKFLFINKQNKYTAVHGQQMLLWQSISYELNIMITLTLRKTLPLNNNHSDNDTLQ